MSQHEYPHMDRYRNICRLVTEFKHNSDGTPIMTMTEVEYTNGTRAKILDVGPIRRRE